MVWEERKTPSVRCADTSPGGPWEAIEEDHTFPEPGDGIGSGICFAWCVPMEPVKTQLGTPGAERVEEHAYIEEIK